MRLFKSISVMVFALCVSFFVCAETVYQKDPECLYVCSFNVYKFGAVAEKYTLMEEEIEEADLVSSTTFAVPERVQNVAGVLAVGTFDLIVLQEVAHGAGGKAAVEDLLSVFQETYGLTYQYFLSDDIGPGFGMDECMAFIFNPAVVKPELLPGQASLTQTIDVPPRALVRTQWEAGDFDFTLISVHLSWGDESDRRTGFEKVNEILWTDTPSPFSDDPDIIILGDFNRFGNGFEAVRSLRYDRQRFLAPNITFFDPDFYSRKTVSPISVYGTMNVPGNCPDYLSTTTAKSCYVYDMFLLSHDVAEEFPPGTGLPAYTADFGIIPFDADMPELYGYPKGAQNKLLSHYNLKIAYSDHRPLWLRFKMHAGQADDGPGGIDLNPPAAVDEYVATKYGKCFHRPSCPRIKNSTIHKRWTRRDEAAAELVPCSVCDP